MRFPQSGALFLLVSLPTNPGSTMLIVKKHTADVVYFTHPPKVVVANNWLSQFAANPERVRSFCEVNGILSDVEKTIGLVHNSFPAVQKVTLRLTEDSESGVEKLTVDIAIGGEAKDAYTAYDAFLDRWIAAVEWAKRALIRLAYNPV
jgi:hypothetical protein